MKIIIFLSALMCLILILVIYYSFFGLKASRKHTFDKIDFFHPINVITIFVVVQLIFPFLYSLGVTNLDANDAFVFTQKSDWDIESLVFFINHLLLYFTIVVSYYFFSNRKLTILVFYEKYRIEFQARFLFCVLIVSLGLFFAAVGSPISYFQDIVNRHENLKGNAGFLILFQAISFLAIPLVVKRRQNLFNIVFLLLIIGSNLFSGSRTSLVAVFIAIVISFYYKVSNFRIKISPKIVVPVVITIFILFVIPSWRSGGNANIDLAFIAKDFSTYRTALIVNYEVLNNGSWGGGSFIDFFAAFVPRNLYANKPPVDEGVYINALADMQSVRPSLPATELPATSWPLGNASLYLNFGFFGTFFGGILIGLIYAGAYKLIFLSRFSNLHLSHYAFLCTGIFAISNLYLFNALIFFVLTFFSVFLFSIRLQRG